MKRQKVYKSQNNTIISSLRIVSMIPGDQKVAGCLIFSNCFWRIF